MKGRSVAPLRDQSTNNKAQAPPPAHPPEMTTKGFWVRIIPFSSGLLAEATTVPTLDQTQ